MEYIKSSLKDKIAREKTIKSRAVYDLFLWDGKRTYFGCGFAILGIIYKIIQPCIRKDSNTTS